MVENTQYFPKWNKTRAMAAVEAAAELGVLDKAWLDTIRREAEKHSLAEKKASGARYALDQYKTAGLKLSRKQQTYLRGLIDAAKNLD